MAKYTLDPFEVMAKYKAVAVLGASKNPEKDAYTVPAYLIEHGYTIVPVNPTADSIHGVKAYPSLAEIPGEVAGKIDVVDVFRPSEEFPDIARQVVEMRRRTGRPFVFWGQLGLENEDAKRILSEGNVDYVMDMCIRTVHKFGAARKAGGT